MSRSFQRVKITALWAGTIVLMVLLKDAFNMAATGRGSTWPQRPYFASWLPGVRIDHIFISPEFTCTNFFVGGFDGSDHLPIVADVGFVTR